MNKRKKAACVERSMRSTGMGAYSDSHLYSIKQRKELFPARSSRTGNHREKTWFLLPGKYWEARASISNSGKGGWSVSVLCVDENLTETHEAAPVPEWLRPLLPTHAIDFKEETFMTATFETREAFGAFFSRMCGTCVKYENDGCTKFGKVFDLAENPPDEWVTGENELPLCTLWESRNSDNDLNPEVALVRKLAKVQLALHAPKTRKNEFGKFNYRSCEDILEAVKPLLKECVILLEDEVTQIGDRMYLKATASFTDGIDTIKVSALAREPLERKGMDDAQFTGATSSYARKYALGGLLAIDDGQDPDTQRNEEKPKPSKPSEEQADKIIQFLRKAR